MFNLFKRKKKYPAFRLLNTFARKDYYFVRTAEWGWLDEENIFITDPHNARVFTLDPWPQLVFIAANGQMPVTEYVYYIADQYDGDIPAELDQTIITELLNLAELKIIDWVKEKQRPEEGFELPGLGGGPALSK